MSNQEKLEKALFASVKECEAIKEKVETLEKERKEAVESVKKKTEQLKQAKVLIEANFDISTAVETLLKNSNNESNRVIITKDENGNCTIEVSLSQNVERLTRDVECLSQTVTSKDNLLYQLHKLMKTMRTEGNILVNSLSVSEMNKYIRQVGYSESLIAIEIPHIHDEMSWTLECKEAKDNKKRKREEK